MSTYSTPTILKETLSNGHNIPIILYEMNPLRDPNKRINHYRNIFENESSFLNKTQTSFKKTKSTKKTRKKKEQPKSVNNKLYNSLYQKLFLRINYERPREIRNENGIIISRHFKTLDINSKVFPDQRIKSYFFSDKLPSQKKFIFNDNIIQNNKFSGSNFFSTEIKYPLNKNSKNKNVEIGINKKYNSLSNLNNAFSKTVYISNNRNNKFFNIENYKTNNNNPKQFSDYNKFNSKGIPPLLIYKNSNSNSNSNKKLNNDIDNTKNLFKVK